MIPTIIRLRLSLALAVLTLLGGAILAGSAAPASAATCSATGQNIRTTHSWTTTTVTIITRRCGRSYRAWARFADGKNIKGPWRTLNPSTAYDPNGGNQTGGYQWEPTGGGTVHTHISY